MANPPPSTPRRTTRSSTTSAPLPATPPKPKPKPLDLLLPNSGDERLPLASLLAALPGRKQQAFDLLRLLAPPCLPVLLHGAGATGKTRTLLLSLRHLRRPFAYAALRSLPSPRALFASLLSQLLPQHLPRRHSDKPSDFVASLRDALIKLLAELRAGETVYLVFDNLELVRGWEKGSAVLSLLLRLHDLLRMPQVGFVYVSSATPEAYYSMTGSVEPNYVYFPDYTVDELRDILVRNQPNPKLYSSFLSVVLKPFFRITRRVDELATVFEPLFRKYSEPLGNSKAVPDEGMRRRLFEHIQPHLAAALNETFSVPVMVSCNGCKDGASGKKGGFRKQIGGRDGFFDELDFHMSASAKYLLLSAFLASRNPATLDAALFDSTGGSDGRKRKRKNSSALTDMKDSVVEEMLMKGPGTFPLERLLAIFQCITSVSEDLLDEVEHPDGPMNESGSIGLMSDVLLQLSTLCNSNFLSKSGSCPLEGSARYRSNIDEDLALKVARSVNFPLSKYLYRR